MAAILHQSLTYKYSKSKNHFTQEDANANCNRKITSRRRLNYPSMNYKKIERVKSTKCTQEKDDVDDRKGRALHRIVLHSKKLFLKGHHIVLSTSNVNTLRMPVKIEVES